MLKPHELQCPKSAPILIALLPLVQLQAALGISDFSAALGISDFSAALGLSRRLARARLAQALGTVCRVVGSATQCCRTALLGSAWYCRWAALGPWQRGLGSAWALAALGPWQRLGLGSAGQRCGSALGSAGQRWAALACAGQRWAALGRLGMGSAGQRWYWQRLAALGIYRQRLVLALALGSAWALALGSAAQLWAALGSGLPLFALPSGLKAADQRCFKIAIAATSAAQRCPALFEVCR